MTKLYAFYLGGTAPKANTELHDVVFSVGTSVEELYTDLLGKWFGSPEKCHIDSWMELTQVDGYDISLIQEKPTGDNRLYFVNMGAYKEDHFTEFHENRFVIAKNESEAKKWALQNLMKGMEKVHKDDLYDVDDCITLDKIDGYHIQLTKALINKDLVPNNDYHQIPKHVIEGFIREKNG